MKVAILSDIHANKYAFELVLKDLDRCGCEKVLVLGDLVGYYYWPKEIVSKIQSEDRFVAIKGNHEVLLERCINDSDFDNQCYLKYGSGLRYCLTGLNESELQWLFKLPTDRTVVVDGVNIAMHHGSDESVDEYIYPDTDSSRFRRVDRSVDYHCFGHTHYPMVINCRGVVLINPGSVGQPRDIGSLASYAIFNTENHSIVLRRVPYLSSDIREKSKHIDPHLPYLGDIQARHNPYV